MAERQSKVDRVRDSRVGGMCYCKNKMKMYIRHQDLGNHAPIVPKTVGEAGLWPFQCPSTTRNQDIEFLFPRNS